MYTSFGSQFCQKIHLCEGAQTLLTENSKGVLFAAMGVVGITLIALRVLRATPSASGGDLACRDYQPDEFVLLSAYAADVREKIRDNRIDAFATANKFPSRNRYPDVKPNDSNRVTFGMDTYFNASWVLGNRAIACQGPLSNEIDEFWKMVNHTGIKAIVSLLDISEDPPPQRQSLLKRISNRARPGKKKVEGEEPFRPRPKCSDFYSSRRVSEETLHEERSKKNHEVERKIICRILQDGTNQVRQYHLIGWPDMGVVPARTLAKLVQIVREREGDEKILVHCSAGIGRTGTFLAADEAFRARSMDILPIAKGLRSYEYGREGMIQTGEQYDLVKKTVQLLLT